MSILISNMIRIETAILSLNEVSMDFKLENRKSGQISLLYTPFWAKSRMVHFDSSISSFWRGGKFAGALPSPCWTWRGKIFGKMFALIFPNARVIFWSLIKIVCENPIVAVIWKFMLKIKFSLLKWVDGFYSTSHNISVWLKISPKVYIF